MKKKFVLIVFILIAELVAAQKKDSCYAGVYLNKTDFVQNHLSYKINEDIKGDKLKFAFPADLTFELKLVKQDSVMRFKPGTIYGYYECGAVFRYSSGTAINAQEGYYKIEEAKELIIYSCPLLYGSEIFYSLNLTSPIHRLTEKNLENDFKGYPEFINSIRKINRKMEGNLAERSDSGYFQINRIYRETISPGK